MCRSALHLLFAVLAMWAAAALILATTLAARWLGAFPRWLVRLGFAASVFVFLLGPSVMGLLGVPVWTLAVGLALAARGGGTRREVGPVPSMRSPAP